MGPGLVEELSAELLPAAGERPLVALGGGRVIDTAKAIAGDRGGPARRCPRRSRGPSSRRSTGCGGWRRARMVRPSLVVADPA